MCTGVLTAVVLILLSGAAAAQPAGEALKPRWTRTFARDFSIVNTSVASEYGMRWRDRGMPDDLTTIDAVDTARSTLLVLEGPPDRSATLIALDAHSGATRWEKSAVRLTRWRPFPSYVVARGSFPAYFARVIGGVVLLAVANDSGTRLGCPARPGLVALDLADGRLLWCSPDIPAGDITYVAVPEDNTVLAWSATDQGVVLLAIDLRNGTLRWKHPLNVDGENWIRALTFMTALTGDDSTRPPLYDAGRVVVFVGEAGRVGPVVRPSNQIAVRLVDLESGSSIWEAPVDVPGRRTFLSWTFSERSLIVTTGKHVNAYDRVQGTRLWSTALDDVRSLRVARGAERDVVIVDFDARNWLLAPTRTGRGLAALDVKTGEILWRNDKARVLQPLDRVGASVFIEADGAVRSLAVDSGREVRSFRPPFEERPRLARQDGPDLTIVQSANELAVYRDGSATPSRTSTFPLATRGVTMIVIAAVLGMYFAPLQFVITAATAAALAPSTFELGSREFIPAAQHAFFATGRGDSTRIVTVNLHSGVQETVAPFIWGGRGKFSLGNLLDQPHGLIYTLDERTLAGYDFTIDRDAHKRLHRVAELQRAIELYERAPALDRAGRREAAMSETVLAARALDALLSDPLSSTTERVAMYMMLGDSYAQLFALSPVNDRTEPRRRGVAAYEQAMTALMTLATDPSSVAVESTRTDLESRLTRLRQQ